MENKTYHPVTLHLEEGDIIKSQKGIMQKSLTTGKIYIVKKLMYIKDSNFKNLSEMEEVNVVKTVEVEK